MGGNRPSRIRTLDSSVDQSIAWFCATAPGSTSQPLCCVWRTQPAGCLSSGLESKACYRSAPNVLAATPRTDGCTPVQNIQCLAKARLEIDNLTRQDSKGKNLAQRFPLCGDFSSLSFVSSFLFLFSFFPFLKMGIPMFTR